MAWREFRTDEFLPSEHGILYNELASLMEVNESLSGRIYTNFWDMPRNVVGSPNPRQDYLRDKYFEFAKQNESDELFISLLYGATRSGKTEGVIALILEILLTHPGCRALGSRRTYTQLQDSLIPSIADPIPTGFLQRKGYVPREDYEIRSGDRPGLYFKNGSSWVFRSTDRADKAGEGKADNLGGAQYDLVLLEECDEIDEGYYKTIVGRMSGPAAPARAIFMIENPPSQEHWTYRLFFKDRVADPRSNYFAMHFPTEDNQRNLPPGYIESLEKEYSADPGLYRKFRLGLFTPAIKGKPIFKGYFNRKIHVAPQSLSWNKNMPLWRIWDFGFRHPAMVIGQEDKETGQIKWLRAHLGDDELLAPFAERMLKNCKRWYPDADYIDICDQAGKKRSGLSDKSEVQVLEAMGLRPRYKYSLIEWGIQLLWQELSTLLPGGKPAMIFDPHHATILVDAFEFGYTQDPNAKSDDIRPIKDGNFDHCMDCARYAVVMFRTLTNAKAPKRKMRKNFRKFEPGGEYTNEFTSVGGRKGPRYSFGRGQIARGKDLEED